MSEFDEERAGCPSGGGGGTVRLTAPAVSESCKGGGGGGNGHGAPKPLTSASHCPPHPEALRGPLPVERAETHGWGRRQGHRRGGERRIPGTPRRLGLLRVVQLGGRKSSSRRGGGGGRRRLARRPHAHEGVDGVDCLGSGPRGASPRDSCGSRGGDGGGVDRRRRRRGSGGSPVLGPCRVPSCHSRRSGCRCGCGWETRHLAPQGG